MKLHVIGQVPRPAKTLSTHIDQSQFTVHAQPKHCQYTSTNHNSPFTPSQNTVSKHRPITVHRPRPAKTLSANIDQSQFTVHAQPKHCQPQPKHCQQTSTNHNSPFTPSQNTVNTHRPITIHRSHPAKTLSTHIDQSQFTICE